MRTTSAFNVVRIDRLAAMFKALAHPQRLRIFLRLAATCCLPATRHPAPLHASYCCASDLGAGLNLAPSTVSHHLKELRQAGVMRVRRHGQRIDCWIERDTLHLLASFCDTCGSQTGTGRCRPPTAHSRNAEKGKKQ